MTGAAIAPDSLLPILGGFAGLLIGGLVVVSRRNVPRWLTGCTWIGGGLLLGGPAFYLMGALLPAWVGASDGLGWGIVSILFGPLIGASVAGLVFSELAKRRVERNGS
jgi:hypothetical protein